MRRLYDIALSLAVMAIVLAHSACNTMPSTNGTGTSNPTPPPSQQNYPALQQLSIAPVEQQLPDWCWLASGQMVLQYYQIPPLNLSSYQCGIIAVLAGVTSPCFTNCSLCDVGAGSGQNIAIMLQTYSEYATNGQYAVTAQYVPGALTYEQVQAEIVAGRPIIAGINPDGTIQMFGQSEHAVVVIGYQLADATPSLVVNDPFPYELVGVPDPYLAAGAELLQPGQYLIPYAAFIQQLLWNSTVDDIQVQ